jgi:uncharacterized RDD family membrane protein YckC
MSPAAEAKDQMESMATIYVVASVWRRIAAALSDATILVLFSMILTIAANICLAGTDPNSLLWICTYALQLLFLLLYCLNGSQNGASLGFRMAGIELARSDGGDLSKLRSFCRILMGILLLPLFLFSLCTLPVYPGRTVADLICNTKAVFRARGVGSEVEFPERIN